jgi:hypothetical protein
MIRAALVALLALTAIIATASIARAAPLRASLEVRRAPGAETCAGQSELTKQIETIADASILSGPEPRPVSVMVRIRPAEPGYVAVIELSGGRIGERTLDDAGPGCEALSQALAVTIAILLEPDEAVVAVSPKPDDDPLRPPDFVPPPLTPKIDTSAPTLTLTAGAYYDFGTLDDSAGGVSLSADTFVPYVSFGLTFLGIPYDPNERPEGVVYRFLAARARACTRAPVLEQFGASFCSGILAGERRAQVDGEGGEEFSKSGAYAAASLQLEVSRRVIGPFGVFAELGMSIPFVQESIDVRIPGLLVATSPYEVVTFQMGAGVRFWFGRGVPAQ